MVGPSEAVVCCRRTAHHHPVQKGSHCERSGKVFLSTWNASRWNPLIRPFYDRLRAAGKPPEVTQVACMRKLLTILNAMVRDGTTWSPEIEPELQHGC